MPQINVTLTIEQVDRVREAAAARGFSSKTDFVRQAIMNELAHSDRNQLNRIEAFLICLSKAFFLRVPEPPAELKGAMKEQALESWNTFLSHVRKDLANT